MNLPNNLVTELKEIMKQDFNLNLNPKKAKSLARSLVSYFDLLAKIDFNNEHNHEKETF